MNKKKILMSIVGLLIIAIGLSSAYYMTITDKDNSVDTSTVSDKTENVNKYQDIIDEYDTNKAINAEFTGFIRFESGIIDEPFVLAIIQGCLEFSSGSLKILQFHSFFVYPCVCFFLSFSGLSVLMQVDNILEGIPYSFSKYLIDRLIHGICSFLLCCLLQYLTL